MPPVLVKIPSSFVYRFLLLPPQFIVNVELCCKLIKLDVCSVNGAVPAIWRALISGRIRIKPISTRAGLPHPGDRGSWDNCGKTLCCCG
jgi:hypothetical protein